MMRGRGGGRDRRHSPYRSNWPSRPPHQSFDIWKAGEIFPNTSAKEAGVKDDRVAKAIIERHGQLKPPASELTACSDLLTKLGSVLDNLIVTQGGKEDYALEEVRTVGCHKLGISLAGDMQIEMIIIFKKWPTTDSISGLVDVLKKELSTTAPSAEVIAGPTGFTVSLNGVKGTCHAATLPDSWIEPDVKGHVDMKAIEFGLAQIRRTRWFEENVSQTITRMLCRILIDTSRRVEGFGVLSEWMLQLLAHQSSVLPGQRDALPIADSLRRALQFLASGIFLKPNLGIVDPCEPNCRRVHEQLEVKSQDDLCCAAQTLLRWLSHGAERQVLGLQKSADVSMTVKCKGIIVEPSVAVAGDAGEATSPSDTPAPVNTDRMET